MGFRYRKSINVGCGFRINMSKSGIGYSWGVRGARITKTARGTTRGTISIPGTGISYVEESGKKPHQNLKNTHRSEGGLGGADSSKSTEKVNVADYQSAEYQDLLNSIKKIQSFNLISTILIWTFLFAAVPLFIFTGIAGIVLKIYVHTKFAISMDYEFDEETKAAYDNLNAVWMSLNENKKFWQTISESQINRKTNGGASRGITRIPSRAINKLPYFIKTNVNPFGLKLRKQKLYFLPDKLMVISGKKVGAINYSDITMRLGTSRFVETDPVPKDAKIVDQTWLKVNKDGTPDKRFKANCQVPICEYGAVIIESGTTLYVELMCSNSSTIQEMRIHATKVFKK